MAATSVGMARRCCFWVGEDGRAAGRAVSAMERVGHGSFYEGKAVVVAAAVHGGAEAATDFRV